MRLIRLSRPDGCTRMRSPGDNVPLVNMPQKPRKSRLGRLTHCTGSRAGCDWAWSATSIVSSRLINVGPWYHGVFGLGDVMLSPCSADSGTDVIDSMPNGAAKARYSSSILRNTSAEKSTRSILLIASTTFLMPIRLTRKLCRRVCVSTPLRASIRMIARSAVDAPVTMLRVYCSWPGVSATMNLRRSVEKKRYATSIVMPCSRSAASPSTSSAKSISPPCVPHFLLSASIAASWSSNSIFDSYSSRPISVLLPSSTEPQVMKRSSPLRSCCSRYAAMSVAMRSETWAMA